MDRIIITCNQNNVRIRNRILQYRRLYEFTLIPQTENLKSIIYYGITHQKTKLEVQDVKAYGEITCVIDSCLVKTKITPSRL